MHYRRPLYFNFTISHSIQLMEYSQLTVHLLLRSSMIYVQYEMSPCDSHHLPYVHVFVALVASPQLLCHI